MLYFIQRISEIIWLKFQKRRIFFFFLLKRIYWYLWCFYLFRFFWRERERGNIFL